MDAQSQTTNPQFLEGPTLPRSPKYYQSYTNHTINHNIYLKPQLIFQLEKTPVEQTVQCKSVHWTKYMQLCQQTHDKSHKYLYILFFNLVFFFKKIYFVVEPEPIATVPLVWPGWTICWIFFQLINSIDIPLGTNREVSPPIFMPNQCCISSRLFFTVTNQISATVQDLKIRVQVVAPHLS